MSGKSHDVHDWEIMTFAIMYQWWTYACLWLGPWYVTDRALCKWGSYTSPCDSLWFRRYVSANVVIRGTHCRMQLTIWHSTRVFQRLMASLLTSCDGSNVFSHPLWPMLCLHVMPSSLVSCSQHAPRSTCSQHVGPVMLNTHGNQIDLGPSALHKTFMSCLCICDPYLYVWFARNMWILSCQYANMLTTRRHVNF